MLFRKLAFCALMIVATAAMMSGVSSAAVLVDYKPTPASPVTPEFLFGGPGTPSLQTGPGAIGNGDGVLPLGAQTAGGLESEAPFLIPGIPGGNLNVPPGSTTFYDTSLLLSGLAASAPAINSFGTLIQQLGNGGFAFFSTDPGTGPILLLSGTISSATIVGANGGGAGAVFSASGVTYTGGAIYAALLAAGGNPNAGDMSISMTDVTPSFGIDGSTGFLNAFSANATGLFSYVPEPTAIAFAGLAATAFFRRRR